MSKLREIDKDFVRIAIMHLEAEDYESALRVLKDLIKAKGVF